MKDSPVELVLSEECSSHGKLEKEKNSVKLEKKDTVPAKKKKKEQPETGGSK